MRAVFRDRHATLYRGDCLTWLAEREPGEQGLELPPHLPELLMKPVDRLAEGMEQIGVVAVWSR